MAKITQFLETHYFSDEGFLTDNITFIEQYAALRVRGVYSAAAFRRVFGSINCVDPMETRHRVDSLEASDTYSEAFERLLKSTPVDQMLSDKKALQSYLDIASNPMLKESVRVQALKEACVLAGITTIDDAGRTKKVPTLDDLYAEHGTALEAKANGEPGKPLH
ncbi:hypothetical protein [Caballeronia sp. AZ10_KS36]|uniref:hypothetical protein n=1 Tax=Caballeronia sp. AZ10_KS36 TaxID=2921757 RepID=UPI00202864FA|nr:hypothetical protein [Caballeronia sp. AZ10_KS36]